MPSLMDELEQLRKEGERLRRLPFKMLVREIFAFNGLVWIVGTVESGRLRVKDTIKLTGGNKPDLTTTITGLMLGSGPKNEIFPFGGEQGVILEGIQPEQIEAGMIITKVGENDTDAALVHN